MKFRLKKQDHKKVEIKHHMISMGILSGIACMLLYRAFRGFDWGDESFYLALTNRFYRGDVPFRDEWHLSQLYAIILLPIYSGFVEFTGSTDGVYLFFRILTTFLFFLTSMLTYKVIYQYTNSIRKSVFCAITILIYSRASMPTLSYYNVSFLSFILAVLSVFNMISEQRQERIQNGIQFWLFGICVAIAVCTNPYTVVIFLIVLIVMFWYAIRDRIWITRLVGAVSGCATVALPFLMYLLNKISLREILDNLSMILHDPEHTEQPALLNAFRWFHEIFKKFGYVEIALLAIIIIITFYAGVKKKKMQSLTQQSVALVSLIIGISCVLKGSDMIGAAYVVLSILGLIAFLLRQNWNDITFYLIYLPGIALSFAWKYGSNTGLTTMAIGFAVSAMGSILLIMELAEEANASGGAPYLRRDRVFKMMIIAFVVCVLVQTFYLRIFYVHRDAQFMELTQRITQGPAKGLYTEQGRKLQYDEIIEALDRINNLTDSQDRVLISNLLPWCYPYLEAGVGAHSTWRVPLSSEYAKKYYMRNEKMKPDVIFALNPEYGITNSKNPIDGVLGKYLMLQEAPEEIIKSGTIYDLRENK